MAFIVFCNTAAKDTHEQNQESILGPEGVKLLQELKNERKAKEMDRSRVRSIKKLDYLWGYEGTNGPAHWHSLHKAFALCGQGTSQSPIDIPPTTIKRNLNIEVDYENSSIGLFNNGKTLFVNYFAKAKILLNKTKYKLIRLQFHTPSEHRVGGIEYPMEIQFYHRSAENNVAMISVFVEQGETNPLLEKIWNFMPEHINHENVIREKKFNAKLLFPNDSKFYFYTGSLTTPPCTENIPWVIFTNPIQASREQLEIFSTILDNNIRPIQATNNRAIRIDS